MFIATFVLCIPQININPVKLVVIARCSSAHVFMLSTQRFHAIVHSTLAFPNSLCLCADLRPLIRF